jgi:hypothetical protein
MLRAGRLLSPGECRGFLVRRRMIPQTDAITFLPPTDAGYSTAAPQPPTPAPRRPPSSPGRKFLPLPRGFGYNPGGSGPVVVILFCARPAR